MIGTDAFQEVDTYGMSIPITKHNYLVRDIAQLPEIVICDAFWNLQRVRSPWTCMG